MSDVLELFAGPGGWSVALRGLAPGLEAIGLESDPDACATAMAADHKREQRDVSLVDPREFAGVVGLIASPPCQSYSAAGSQKGKLDRPRIEAHLDRIAQARRWMHYSPDGWHDPRSALVLEPLRFAIALRPQWIALEQVPAVLPLWARCADVLTELGYSARAGMLHAEEHGVPQTRKRAVLTASLEREAALPVPTHRRYVKGRERAAGDPSLLPWVSMADALGWSGVEPGRLAQRSNYSAHGRGTAAERGRTIRELDEPSVTMTSKAAQWQARNSGPGAARDPRPTSAPSYTVRANGSGSHPSGVQWARFGNQEHSAVRELDEPAATIRYGRRANASDWGPVRSRVTVEEAAILQTFPAGYPWAGNLSAQYRQVGDAIPPVLASAILAGLL